ncbi:desmoglein-2-like [Megalops cyprinoides]|uniref:desmoglein-2-like n=1 Tax=Megalops cyprinoides TaxID=118141 RepID=UPI001863A93E|nr:desmoglein-2-like [Megalops cyprinoides]
MGKNMRHTMEIRSDQEFKAPVRYYLKGRGADEPPVNVFIVDPISGYVRVTGILDREHIPVYHFEGFALYPNGTRADGPIELRIQVADENDCAPVFDEMSPGSVYESSPTDTFVMKISATDDDEPGGINSKIAYSIVSQSPGGDMFYIKPDGSLYVRIPCLDREIHESYTLIVKGTDLDGAVNGNTGTGTVKVNILDVNDNVPTLDKEDYTGSIDENIQGVEVMRFKASDLDLENTNNWLAQFEIISGNEAGHFSITTDPKTNEGILMLEKPVDYEDVKEFDLEVTVANKAPFHVVSSGGFGGYSSEGGICAGEGRGAGGGEDVTMRKTYPVKIKVNNLPEGPMFSPKIKAVPVSEDSKMFNIKNIIATYPAIDGDTLKPAENVRYVKGHDPDNWLVIDENTAEIRLNKAPDREFKHLVNGTCYAKILCITQDMPSKTATGTIAVQVEDMNDHCPTLTGTSQTLCSDEKVVFATAVDEDADPNGAPFKFTIISEETKGKWTVERLNDTTAILRAKESLFPGSYKVTLEIADQQGEFCPERQVMKVDVCTCTENRVCKAKDGTGAGFGALGTGLLVLGIVMLLLALLLLLFCTCGGGRASGFAVTLHEVKIRENVVVPNQTYLIQQPVYYATAPVLQATRYVVEPQVHNTVLVSEMPSVPTVQCMW